MRLLPAAALLALAAAPAAAQAPARAQQAPARAAAGASMPSRAVLLEDVERSRQNVLKYLDAAPDSMLAFRPMPGVRTFAGQVAHAAGANPFILAGAWKVQSRFRPDSTAEQSKAGLRALVNGAYDEFARLVREAPESQLTASGTFANMTKPNWRWVGTALEHSTWTLGQTVPYLRANSVTPPQYLPF
jgi:hypothetical protein